MNLYHVTTRVTEETAPIMPEMLWPMTPLRPRVSNHCTRRASNNRAGRRASCPPGGYTPDRSSGHPPDHRAAHGFVLSQCGCCKAADQSQRHCHPSDAMNR